MNCHLLNFSSAPIFKVLPCRSKLVKMLSECQTAWIRVRRRVTRRLIRIQAICIWHLSCAWRAKGFQCFIARSTSYANRAVIFWQNQWLYSRTFLHSTSTQSGVIIAYVHVNPHYSSCLHSSNDGFTQ